MTARFNILVLVNVRQSGSHMSKPIKRHILNVYMFRPVPLAVANPLLPNCHHTSAKLKVELSTGISPSFLLGVAPWFHVTPPTIYLPYTFVHLTKPLDTYRIPSVSALSKSTWSP